LDDLQGHENLRRGLLGNVSRKNSRIKKGDTQGGDSYKGNRDRRNSVS
jgi:hypothetical protein